MKENITRKIQENSCANVSKLADSENELVLEDQTISPGSPKVTKEDSDEVIQLLVTVEIETGENQSDVEKTAEIEAPPDSQVAETVAAVEDVIQNGEEKPEQPCEEVEEAKEPPEEPDEKPEEPIISSGTIFQYFCLNKTTLIFRTLPILPSD